MEDKKNTADSRKLLREFMLFEHGDIHPSTSSDGILKMEGIIQIANKVNANGRLYPRSILEREDKKYQELIKDRRALGELDHPSSSCVELQNVSHLFTKTFWEGDNLYGELEVLDTPKGNILAKLVERNIKLGISSRCLGETKRNSNGIDVVDESLSLIAFDAVGNPSTSGAFMNLRESKDYRILTESNRLILLDEILNEILNLK